MRGYKKSWAWFCLVIGTIVLALGMNGMPIGLLVLAGAATACGLNNVLKGDCGRSTAAHDRATLGQSEERVE